MTLSVTQYLLLVVGVVLGFFIGKLSRGLKHNEEAKKETKETAQR